MPQLGGLSDLLRSRYIFLRVAAARECCAQSEESAWEATGEEPWKTAWCLALDGIPRRWTLALQEATMICEYENHRGKKTRLDIPALLFLAFLGMASLTMLVLAIIGIVGEL